MKFPPASAKASSSRWASRFVVSTVPSVSRPNRQVPKQSSETFVPVDPMVISLGSSAARHLRFQAQLEVGAPHEAEVTKLMPRVVDVLNSYLRALEPEDLEASSALIRLRAQMLRRVQIVTGGDRVRDLLIMEFVLN